MVGWCLVRWVGHGVSGSMARAGVPPLHYALCEPGDMGEGFASAGDCQHCDRVRALPFEVCAQARLQARLFMCVCEW